ncbi:MAG: response regulator transcription factor [Solirubrobacterales bacterium]|nr:response regulator transcription factor [Solirubrobacterales bacterium]MBV9717546.1 response regulator transcription factor [Solirubrobacterales bacterium]
MSSLAVGQPQAATGSRGAVLVVDDEPTIAEVVARYLHRAGYETAIASDGASAMDAVAALRPDLIVLDVKLPRIDGLEVMRRLHGEDTLSPAVILLSGKSRELDRIIGLRSGADDYVVKPFSAAELVARVDAVLRRAGSRPPARMEPMQFGELRIDLSARRVYVRGQELQLPQREFDLLLYLARHPGQVFSRDELISAVWHYSFYTDTSTVTVHIRRLRAKIEDDPARPRHLKTVWGVGYRFEP